MNITNLYGSRVSHPLLISVVNIEMSMCLKLSSKSFMLMALLSVPKFIHKIKHMCGGVLEDHECLDIILEPVKKAAEFGIMLPDTEGHSHYFFTPITGYVIDTPVAYQHGLPCLLVSGVKNIICHHGNVQTLQ